MFLKKQMPMKQRLRSLLQIQCKVKKVNLIKQSPEKWLELIHSQPMSYLELVHLEKFILLRKSLMEHFMQWKYFQKRR